MFRYTLRVFTEDLANWIPLMLVVAMTAALVGVCANQYAWTTSGSFVGAAIAASLDPAEFHIVSVTIYVEVAFIALVAMTAVGSATVERCRMSFSQWRLAGASPRQLFLSSLAIVAIAAVIGSLVGTLISIPLSHALIPLFNDMAVQSFPGKMSSSFFPPTFSISSTALIVSFLLAWGTCMFGAFSPARQAARVSPIDILRPSDALPQTKETRCGERISKHKPKHSIRARTYLGFALLIAALSIPCAFLFVSVGGTRDGSASSSLSNGMLSSGILAICALLCFREQGIKLSIRLVGLAAKLTGNPVGKLATRAALANADRDASAIIPLAVALGGGTTLLCIVRNFEATIRHLGLTTKLNYTDTFMLFGLAVVFAFATAASVLVLSSKGESHEQALLRTLGLSKSGVVSLMVWRTFLLSASAVLLALLPILSATLAATALSYATWGIPFFHPCFDVIAIALIFLWIALFALQRIKLARPLNSSPIVVLHD